MVVLLGIEARAKSEKKMNSGWFVGNHGREKVKQRYPLIPWRLDRGYHKDPCIQGPV